MILLTEEPDPTKSAPEAAVGPRPSWQRARDPALKVLLPRAAGEASAAVGAKSPGTSSSLTFRRNSSTTTGATPGAVFQVLCHQASLLTSNPTPSAHSALSFGPHA